MESLSRNKPTLTPAVAGELIGTFIVQFFAGSTAATVSENGLPSAALGYGMAMSVMIYSTAHISGGHLNPATTLGFVVTSAHGFSLQEGISYMIAQIFGAVTASFFLKASLPADTLNHPFVTLGSLSDQHWIQVLILESVSTMIVVLIIFATMVDYRRSVAGNAGPLVVGFAYTVGVFACGPFTGASLNPARTLGPAIVFWDFSSVGIYLIATLTGGAAAALLYKFAFGFGDDDDGGEGSKSV